MKSFLKLPFTISSYEVNPKGDARLTAIANFLQEMAYRHAKTLGLGYADMTSRNMAWILSRMRIEILEYPVWDEEIFVETWPCGTEKLFAFRDFKIYNIKGDIIAKACTYWLMVDLKTHRPLRLTDDLFKIVVRTDRAFSEPVDKINIPEIMPETRKRKVVYSDLDVVGHVNNVKYLEWCADLLDSEQLKKATIDRIDINYLGEAVLDDEIEISMSTKVKDEIYISSVNKRTNRECFRAMLIIQDKA